ncbi:asparagine--tRNA ligase [Exilibacterium tricleocarpae]|uniref:Asparagine--tRNA ligase n=1 Tax=Exilibacterium tricleocarpae TaxID=2591008 RepID=A0A545SY54_9GAMM|nr:asparagine--tRNA ligase [Exilibacterium tricleocarpae]TQV69891.1 asparagine--tRNA ligase [Exilibacterium tricleocarpae]
MHTVTVAALFSGEVRVGSPVTVKGWVRTRRTSKAGISFVALHDGSCFEPIQLVVPETLENYATEVTGLGAGCAIIASGELVESEGQGQTVEVRADRIEVVGWVDDPESYPIAKKRHTFEYLRTQAHLRPRTNAFGAITRLRNTLANAIHNYFHDRGFYWVNTPIITASDCEGAGELFRVSALDMHNLPRDDKGQLDYSQDFFGAESFLTVSGQLNLEAYCLAMSKVYTFGPTFRAENSHTSRHLAEFWMVEPEIAFADLEDNAALAEDFLKHCFRTVLEQRQDDMAFFAQRVDKQAITRLEQVIDAEFVHLDYGEAIRILDNCGQKFEFPVTWGADLASEHERYLSEQHVKGPVVVKNYPKDIKAFYMRLNDDGNTVAAMDVLMPGIGEIIGGSQREERLEVLDGRMTAPGLADELWWYRDLRRYGTVPHAGFGLGFERLLNYISGMENIRDAIPYPRTPGNAAF